MINRDISKLNGLLKNVGDMALKTRAKEIILSLDPQFKDRILDVGCGDGYYLHLLSELNTKLRLTGADFDSNALKSAIKKLNRKNIKLVQADLMQKLPFKDGEFDKVIMSEVAEHLPNDVKGLKEVYRVLKPGGVLVLTVPNKNYPFLWDPVNWILEGVFGRHIKTGFWSGIWNQHIRLYTPAQISKVVNKAGFKIIAAESLTWWCLPFNHHLINLVARFLWNGSLSPQLASSLNKYQQNPKRPLLINLAFKAVNLIDSLNTIYQPRNSGVGVFLRAIK